MRAVILSLCTELAWLLLGALPFLLTAWWIYGPDPLDVLLGSFVLMMLLLMPLLALLALSSLLGCIFARQVHGLGQW
ncbi:hypothetical protein [Crenobacter intestini]|uniref:Uncharacterized protein n=1 Tax=Crenobacter intestini TaxID=2563443 RepID=A0A4T0UK30_9NEIS|nr:hypothetical protein [Crenobacter intestini]TIC78952.1 hypothetical protein E5K04_14430 [Crenobacter intestini]